MARLKKDNYIAALREIDIRLEKGGNLVADLANVTAVLKKRLKYYWIGFYFLLDDQLVLGPFQGTPACVYLTLDCGVCAACTREKKTIIVPDVHKYDGHVACDPQSRSEMTVPCFDNRNTLRAVLDMDHNQIDAFDETDRKYLNLLEKKLRTLWDSDKKNNG